MTDYYLDLDAGSNGDGSSGSPWGNQGDWIDDLAYALGQMAGDLSGGGHTLHIRGSGEYTATSANNISLNAENTWSNASASNRLVLRAETRPSAGLEGLRLRRNLGGNPFFYLNVVGSTLDGIGLRNNGGGSFNAKCLQMGVANTQFLNAMALIDSGGQNSGDAIEVTFDFDLIENFVAIGGSSSGRGININAGFVDGTIRNGVLGGADGAARRFASSGVINVHNVLHLDGGGAWTSNSPNGGNNNATLAGTAPAWGSSWVTGVVLANDVVDDSADDYRAQEGGALDQAGDNANAPAEDMFGNTRENPPSIGHSVATTLTVAPVLSNAGNAANVTHNSADTSVDTTVGTGTLYQVLTTSPTTPSEAQIEAGQDHTGAAATSATSQAVNATGTQTVSSTSLPASTTLYSHWFHRSADPLDSNAISGGGFTTSASPDVTAPAITVAAAVAAGLGQATATVTATDASGTFRLHALDTNPGSSNPGEAAIRAGTTVSQTSGQEASAVLTPLPRGDTRRIWVLVDDAAGNVSAGFPMSFDVPVQEATVSITVLGADGSPLANTDLDVAVLEEDHTVAVDWTAVTTNGSGVLTIADPSATAAGQARVVLTRASGGGAGVAAGASIVATAVA